MNILKKSNRISPEQKQLAELKEDLKECRKQMKRAETLFAFATEENLIEARIYEMKSLAKHHDYITAQIRRLMGENRNPVQEKQNVKV